MKTKFQLIALFLLTGIFSARAQSETWNLGSFSVTANDTIVDDCYLSIICGSDVAITNHDSVNSLTCRISINTITNSPAGWAYNMCTPSGCLSNGVYTSTFIIPPLSTRGASFHAHLNNNPGNPILNVSLKDNNNIAIGTTFNVQIGTGTTAIAEQTASGNFLSSNFPNPFTGTSLINYNLPSTTGSLIITDVLGRTMWTTALNNTSGTIVIGEGLSSGIFFCTLMDENGTKLSTRKIIAE